MSRRKEFFPEVTDQQWNDWHWQVKNRIETVDELKKYIKLTAEEEEGIRESLKTLRMAITPYYLTLIDPENPHCPIRKQAIPTVEELKRSPADLEDPLHEDSDSPVPGLTHRYPDRVLFLITDMCSMYCRHCTRRRFAGQHDCATPEKQIDDCIDYIARTPQVRDVLLSGGDALLVSDEKLEYGIVDHYVDSFAPRAFFSTLTNVNFDSPRIVGYAREAIALREALKAQCLNADASARVDNPMAELQLVSDDLGELQRQAAEFTPNKDKAAIGENILGLRLLCLYGLKGAAAYMEHAHVLGQYDNAIYAQYHKIMAWLGTWPSDMNALLECSMEIGQMNFKVMSILDAGETSTYGHPTPTQVNVKATEGKCILISGHDLKDLYNLLKQTEGTGVNVYTHGEMLPAHGYPELRKFKHLIGNYGSGWQNQQVEFARFPGPIVMTSNCIIDPTVGAYDDRIWTRSIVGWPGVSHLEGDDFGPVIAQAQQMAGFPYSEIPHLITVGFGRETLLGAADSLIDLVSREKLRHIFLIGGCDGARGERNYFTDFATRVPEDCLILTLACGKYRFNKLDFGNIEGLPRLVDAGQCNDAYSAIILAVTLAEKLGCGVNDLPLSLVLSWFEQKAIVILLTLLSLGVTNIVTGPTAPGFLTPDLLAILNEKFGLRSVTNVEDDMKQLLSA